MNTDRVAFKVTLSIKVHLVIYKQLLTFLGHSSSIAFKYGCFKLFQGPLLFPHSKCFIYCGILYFCFLCPELAVWWINWLTEKTFLCASYLLRTSLYCEYHMCYFCNMKYRVRKKKRLAPELAYRNLFPRLMATKDHERNYSKLKMIQI